MTEVQLKLLGVKIGELHKVYAALPILRTRIEQC